MKPPADTLSIEGFPADAFRSGPRERLLRITVLVVGVGIALGLIVKLGGSAHLHAPNFALLLGQPFVLQLHIAGAVTALLIGSFLMLRVKGDALHKTLGWAWVIAMLTAAISSFFIHMINPHGFSPIHVLSAYVTLTVPMGVAFIRRSNIKAHRRVMTGSFIGGLIIAGAFTFLPGRLMWKVFFG